MGGICMRSIAPYAATKPSGGLHDLLDGIETQARAARSVLTAPPENACGNDAANDAAAVLVADAVHLLAILHGEIPSLIDLVTEHHPAHERLLAPAAATFQGDRAWLTALAVATGTRVDLAGLSETETLVRELRAAMLILARSKRDGCALGAILAFLNDWPPLRTALDEAGARAFADRWIAAEGDWPDEPLAEISGIAERGFDNTVSARAIAFGAQQFASLHHQLLDLFAARADRRSA